MLDKYNRFWHHNKKVSNADCVSQQPRARRRGRSSHPKGHTTR
jgi:hypothetical protein